MSYDAEWNNGWSEEDKLEIEFYRLWVAQQHRRYLNHTQVIQSIAEAIRKIADKSKNKDTILNKLTACLL